MRVYGESKLANILFTLELARRLAGQRRDRELAASGHGAYRLRGPTGTPGACSPSGSRSPGRSSSRRPREHAPRCTWRRPRTWRTSAVSTSSSASRRSRVVRAQDPEAARTTVAGERGAGRPSARAGRCEPCGCWSPAPPGPSVGPRSRSWPGAATRWWPRRGTWPCSAGLPAAQVLRARRQRRRRRCIAPSPRRASSMRSSTTRDSPGIGPLETYPLESFVRVLEVNTLGPLRMAQAVAPLWRERGSGVLVNVSSVQGKVGTPLEGAYAASKHALEGAVRVAVLRTRALRDPGRHH